MTTTTSSDSCHCSKPAAWRVLMIPIGPHGHDLPGVVNADDLWASCDEHLADAVRCLQGRESEPGTHRVELRGPYQ